MMNNNIQSPSEKLKSNEKSLPQSIKILFALFIFSHIYMLAIFFHFIKDYDKANIQQIIDLLRILMSWPVIGAIVTLLFIYKFSDSIRDFLETHQLSRAGPIEIKQRTGESVMPPGRGGPNEGRIKSYTKKVAKLKKELETKDKDKAGLEDFVQNQQKINEIYEFNYLALFFVDTTKRVLKWFFDSKGRSIITYESFDIAWQPIILDPNQRTTIFSVLQQNGMIQGVLGGAFSITDKGEKFLRFIGFIQ